MSLLFKKFYFILKIIFSFNYGAPCGGMCMQVLVPQEARGGCVKPQAA